MREVWLVETYLDGPDRWDWEYLHVDSVWSTAEAAVRRIEDGIGAALDHPGSEPEDSSWRDDGHAYFVDRYELDGCGTEGDAHDAG